MKCYSKFEDVCEGQRRCRREICNSAFNTTNISRIRDKFETGSTVQHVYKRQAGWNTTRRRCYTQWLKAILITEQRHPRISSTTSKLIGDNRKPCERPKFLLPSESQVRYCNVLLRPTPHVTWTWRYLNAHYILVLSQILRYILSIKMYIYFRHLYIPVNMHFNTTLPPTPGFPKWWNTVEFSHQHFVSAEHSTA